MTKKMIAGLAVVLASAGSLLGHHSIYAQFDTTKAIRITGTVIRFERINPHSIIIVDQKLADGQMQRWAVEGLPGSQFDRRGIDKDSVKFGDVVEVCGFVTKEGVESHRTINTEPISLSLKATTPKSMTGRLLTGETIVMPDGHEKVLQDYGVLDKCLRPDNKKSQSNQ